MEEAIPVVKKITRARKTVSTQNASTPQDIQIVQTEITQDFDELVAKLAKSKQEFDNLQKEIAQVKQDWSREQKQHELEFAQQKTQEELERKREQETYQYNINLSRKRVEDEFQDRKMSWEKDLSQRKEELEGQKKELDELRKLVAGFDDQKEQAANKAQSQTEKRLVDQFDQGRKLKEQEVKAEKEILGLKIANLETENSRLNKEIEVLKRSLDEATRQVKEIAVKVIESGSSQNKSQSAPES